MMSHVTIRMQIHMYFNAESSTAIYRRVRSLNEETHTKLPIVQTYGICGCISNFIRLVQCIRQILDIIRHGFGPNFININNKYFAAFSIFGNFLHFELIRLHLHRYKTCHCFCLMLHSIIDFQADFQNNSQSLCEDIC